MSTLITTCPDAGEWRAWLDREPCMAGLDEHLEQCAACQRTVSTLRSDAATASDALRTLQPTPLPTPAAIALAHSRFAWRRRHPAPGGWQPRAEAPAPAPQRKRGVMTRLTTPWRVAASGVAAALVVSVGVAFTAQGQTAAAALLAQFRSSQVAAVELSPQSQEAIDETLTTLGNLGTVETRSPTGARTAGYARTDQPRTATMAEAAALLGTPIQTPNPALLGPGIQPTPKVSVVPANEIRFTFDKARAARYVSTTGGARIDIPDKFDGATLVVRTPAAALLEYTSADSHRTLVVAQAGMLEVDAERVTLDEMRTFLLGLPGLPKETVDQLRLMRNWDQTLPIPIPTNKINWSPATFNGSSGLLLNDNTGLGSAAVWQGNGQLHGLAGTLKAADLKRIADSLAAR